MACCDICGAVFTLQKNLKRHISVQHKESDSIKINHDCDQCDYSGTYTNLMQHKLNKHKENKRKCSICLAEFNNKSHLNRHMNSSHKKLLPHTCYICYKGFSRKDVLKNHIKSVHNNQINNKPKELSKSVCNFCNKEYFNVSSLKRHEKNIHFIVTDTRKANEDPSPDDTHIEMNNNNKYPPEK